MKTMRTATLFCVFVALPFGARAQVEFEVTPFVGGTVFLADPPSQFALGHRHGAPDVVVHGGSYADAFTLGVNTGLRFNERWALEGLFSWMPTELSATSGLQETEEVNGYMYGLTGLYYLPVDWPVTPFLGVGIGGETFDYAREDLKTHHELMGNVVGGLFVPLTEGIGMRFEARDCFARFDSGVASVNGGWENDLMLTAGVSFRTPIGG